MSEREATQIKAIVTDIEGTTSSISFVKEILFPYAYKQLGAYITAHQDIPEIKVIIEEVRADLPSNDSSLGSVIQLLQHWIDTDQKKTPLKALQGYIWEAGYKNGDYKAHLYPDAIEFLTQWSKALPLFVYSSGSIKAQDLFFSYSEAGNIKHLFQGFFDTTTGPKKEAQSYLAISQAIDQQPENILFLSDCPDEITAAQQAGLQTCHIQREAGANTNIPPTSTSFKAVDKIFNLTNPAI